LRIQLRAAFGLAALDLDFYTSRPFRNPLGLKSMHHHGASTIVPQGRQRRSRVQTSWILLVAALVLLPGGCVRRRLNVRTNPPGALVYVDNQQIGTTPCSVDFTYYGTREIRLVKPGYETLTVNQPIPAPWYQIPPIDFVSENLTPTKIRDNRTVTYNLAPQVIVPPQELLERANQLRQDTLQYPVQPAGGAAPTGAGMPVGGMVPPPSLPPTTVPPTVVPSAPTQVVPQQGPAIVSPPLR
jgi:hypothetical protein